MLKRYFAPIVLASLVLAGCQSPPEGKFTPEQISAMKSYGFNELNGDWSLGMSDTILFDKNDARLRSESETQIQSMASRLEETGLTHARMDGHTDNYGEESYNEALSLKRANAVADAVAHDLPAEVVVCRFQAVCKVRYPHGEGVFGGFGIGS